MSLGPHLEPRGPRHVFWQGREYLFFGGNDYHRFAFHPEVVEAACGASRRWGLNVSGSRATSANHPIYEALEEALADFLDAESVAIFSAGYMSNAILLQAIGERFTHLIIDRSAHASLVDAARATGLTLVFYEHLSFESFSNAVEGLPLNAVPLVLTDGVFASTGEIAPLRDIHGLGVSLLIDDAHGMATIGERGKGSWSECGLDRTGIYQTGTLSKGLGGFGGVIAADRQTIERVKSRSSAFIGSTPVPIPMAAAALKSIEILKGNPSMIQSLRQRSLKVKRELLSLGFGVCEGPSPICSVTLNDEAKNRQLSDCLIASRIYPNFVNYPGCPPGGHFRFTISSAHEDGDLENLLSALREGVRFIDAQ